MRLTRRGVESAALSCDRSGTANDRESAPPSVFVATSLVDTTLGGALRIGLGKPALTGIVSAEAIALMEGIVKSMTTAKVIFVTAAILIAGLVTAGAGVLGYSATHAENPAPAVTPEQAASPPATAAPVAQDPPRTTATKPAANPGPLVVQIEVVDPEGHRLSGAEVVTTISYTRGTENADSVLERARSDGQGQVRLEVARERPARKSRVRSSGPINPATRWRRRASR